MKLINKISFVIIFLLFSCTNNSSQKPSNKPLIDLSKTRFTFSQYFEVDFVVSSGSFQILYDYSTPLDTFFTYSGAHIIGKDSIIYQRIRKDLTEEALHERSIKPIYYGTISDLVIFTGGKFQKKILPYFNSHFSAFNVKDRTIYYWGFENFEKLYACKYNLITKELKKVKLSNETDGTDFYAHYYPPIFTDKGNVKFEISEQKYWILNPFYERIISFKIPKDENDVGPINYTDSI